MNSDFHVGSWFVQPGLNTVSHNGTSHRLEPKVMEVLVCLARHPGEPLSKEQLLSTVWPHTFVSDDVLTRSISELRRVLEDNPKEPRFIQTIPKRGYRLVVQVARTDDRSELTPSDNAHQRNSKRVIRAAIGLGAVTLLLGVVAGWRASDLRSWLWANGNLPPVRSLAVLPLKNLSGDATQEYLADGMTDELITYVSQVPGLRVISYTSVIPYKDTRKSLPTIARELGVDAVVEGSVQRIGDRIRVNAQLIYASQDTHIWAQSYDRDFKDAMTVQSTLAVAIADQVKIRLTRAEEARFQATRTVNLKALEAYLQGDYHLAKVGDRYSGEEARTAIAFFQDAIREDPNFAAAYVKICQVYETQSVLFSKAERWPTEKAAAEKAVILDPNLPAAHVAVGFVRLLYEWDLPAARAEFERALELDPNSASAHDALGDLFEITNHPHEGMLEHQRAQALDPGSDHVSNSFYRSRQYDRGIELVKKRLELHPEDGGAHFQLFNQYAQKGIQKEAIEEFRQTAILFGYGDSGNAVSRVYVASGYHAAILEAARQMAKYYTRGQLDRPVLVAIEYARLGDQDHALQWLETGYADRDPDLLYAYPEEEFDFLRADSRFQKLFRKVGLPQ